MTANTVPQHKDKENILVVDDNAGVRSLLQMLLQAKGFTVLAASRGLDAVDLVKQKLKDIDLAIIDVHMPEMDGPQTLESIRAINPRLLCCFITGGSHNYDDQELLALGVKHIFKKPISSLPQFLSVIKDVIQTNPPC